MTAPGVSPDALVHVVRAGLASGVAFPKVVVMEAGSAVAGEAGPPEPVAGGLGRVEFVVAKAAGFGPAERFNGELPPTGARPLLVVVRV
jgi:hypothetical protein